MDAIDRLGWGLLGTVVLGAAGFLADRCFPVVREVEERTVLEVLDVQGDSYNSRAIVADVDTREAGIGPALVREAWKIRYDESPVAQPGDKVWRYRTKYLHTGYDGWTYTTREPK